MVDVPDVYFTVFYMLIYCAGNKEKSDEVEESLGGSGVEDEWESWKYLVHCWSESLGDYKHPILFVVLQFWDTQKGERVFYQCTVTHPQKLKGQSFIRLLSFEFESVRVWIGELF